MAVNTGPRDCLSGRRNCSNVGSLDPEKLGYCPGCYDHVKQTCAIPFDEFKTALISHQHPPPPASVAATSQGTDTDDDDEEEEDVSLYPLDGTIYGVAMVYSSRLKCEKCKQVCPAGSLVIGTPGKKTVERAYDPGTHVWRGQVSITKLRHPDCIPLTKRLVADLKEAAGRVTVFRGSHRLTPTVKQALEDWMDHVTSDEAEEERTAKRKASQGYNPDGTKKPRGKFKPKGPPQSWRDLAKNDPDKLLDKSASALKNFLKTYTYEKIPKSISKKALVDVIVGLFSEEE